MSNIFGSGKYQQIGSQAAFRKYDQWDAGDQISGEVLEVRKDKFGKPAYVIRVEEVSFKKTSEQPQVGSLFTLNSAGGLQYKAEQVGGISISDIIGIEYNGKTDVAKGKWAGTKCHDIEFFISKANLKAKTDERMKGNEESNDLDLI